MGSEIAQAVEHHRAGRLQQAEAIYRQVLKSQPKHADALHLLGVLTAQAGKHEAAVTLITRAIKVNPNVAHYYNDLGESFRALKKLDAAIAAYRQALASKPDYAMAHYNLGVALQALGKLVEAIAAYRQALASGANAPEIYNNLGIALQTVGNLTDAVAALQQARALKPDAAEIHYNLGNALHAQDKLTEAITAYQRACTLKPHFAEAHNNLGAVLKKQGRLTEAIASCRQALALQPHYAEAHNNLGTVLKKQGRLTEAIASYRQALALQPHYAEAHNNLGTVLKEQGQLTEAIACYERALALESDFPEAHSNLGNALYSSGRPAEAIAAYRRALAFDPGTADIHSNLGTALRGQGQLTEAIACYERALALESDFAEAHSNLGSALYSSGRPAEAIAAYRRALAFDPGTADIHSNLLLCLNYRSESEPVETLAEHQRWAQHYCLPLAPTIEPHTNDPNPDRRLRIGYVSPDFQQHSVAYFIEPVLAAHDRAAFEIICYANVGRPDDVTQQLQELGHLWRDIFSLSDAEVAELVRKDRVDLLVDLAGHTRNNRLLVFARKPAPVQVSYLGYPNTTGLPTMDYRLTDDWADPPGQTEPFYTEELVHLPGGFLCYQPPHESPAVAPLPATSANHVTFASFNNANKVSSEAVAVWSKILHALPAARLIMKSQQLANARTRQHFAALFEQNGVCTEQVELLGPITSVVEHLALYNQVDIALDTFPYNGTTTTCEALWMGVPVVVLAGDRHASRVGVSLLTNIGFTELIAEAPEAYVDLAVKLAGDLHRLRQLRTKLREKVASSALTDSTRFTRSLETIYRNLWRQWCEKPERATRPEPLTPVFAAPQHEATLIVKVRGDIQVCLPNTVSLLTPYVLLEQEDWFEDEIVFVRQLLKSGMRTIDIGASYGVYSLAMAQAVGPAGKVWSFEPASGPAAFLEESIKQNQFTNIVLSRVGLSNRTGVAKLKLSVNSELNTLALSGDSNRGHQSVQLRTLDDCMQDHGWEVIDFVKMDAEGEEGRIVEGGKKFLREQSPLILFELKHDNALNLSLLQQLKDIGYEIYRLLPGLSILVPFDVDDDLDTYQLNSFCCKPDRAQALEQQGLLTRAALAVPEPPVDERVWPDFLGRLAYTQNLLGAWIAGKSSKLLPGNEAYQRTLDWYARAHTENLSSTIRHGCLKRCLATLLEVTTQGRNVCRLQSLARVAWEAGKREVALRALNDLIAQLHNEPVTLEEPFLAISVRFESINPGNDVKQWCIASALEQQEKLRAFSSYFSGKSSSRKLEMMKDLPFYGPEMERRRQLIRLRYHMQNKPEFHPVLTSPTEGHLNDAFWPTPAID